MPSYSCREVGIEKDSHSPRGLQSRAPRAPPWRQVGPAHTVIVEGYDLAGNKKACHRTVVVKDTQKPQWFAGVSPGIEKRDGACRHG